MISNKNLCWAEIVLKFKMKPHPEGGYSSLLYEETQKIAKKCLPSEYDGDRSFWNGIYYLLPVGSKTILHRIRMTELWNFYLGCPLELYDLSPNGEVKRVLLGQDLTNGQELAYVFPKGNWIAARPGSDQMWDFSLVSCVTAPGFTFADWEKGDLNKLKKQYPKNIELITELLE